MRTWVQFFSFHPAVVVFLEWTGAGQSDLLALAVAQQEIIEERRIVVGMNFANAEGELLANPIESVAGLLFGSVQNRPPLHRRPRTLRLCGFLPGGIDGGTHLGYGDGDGSVTITGTFSDIPVSELTYEDTANGGGVVAVVLGTPMSIDLRAEASGEYFYIDDTPCCWTSGFGTAEITLKFFEAGPGAPVRILYAPPGPEPIPEPSTWGAESCSPRSGV